MITKALQAVCLNTAGDISAINDVAFFLSHGNTVLPACTYKHSFMGMKLQALLEIIEVNGVGYRIQGAKQINESKDKLCAFK